MTSPAIQSNNRDNIRSRIHKTDWRQSIIDQLQLRKFIEQKPFEDLCSHTCTLCDKADIHERKIIQLTLACEQSQQQLLEFQQTLLAGGSAAVKISKLSNVVLDSKGSEVSGSSAASRNSTNTSLLAQKEQLEKKILEVQEKLADTMQKIVDLKTELDEKDRVNRQLSSRVDEKDKEICKLKETLERLDNKHRTLTDEYLALTLSNKSLEKKHHQLSIDFDVLKQQLMAVKMEDADRLNAENERFETIKQDRLMKETEMNVARMPHVHLSEDNFEHLGDYDAANIINLNTPSRVPTTVELSFDAHDGEICALNWFCCSGPRDSYLATGGSDRKVILWKIADGGQSSFATLLGSNASITSIDVEADSILASSNDYAARIWNVTTHKLMQTLTGHSAKVLSAKFLGNPFTIGSGSTDRTVKIWDINKRSCTKTYFAGSSCYDVVYHNHRVISGHFDSKIRCWDLLKPDNNESSGGIILQAKITSLDISRDGTKLLCSLRDNTIKCIDLRKMEVVQTYSDEKFKIGAELVRAKFSVDGQLVSCGSSDGSLYIWDSNTAKVEKILTNHSTTLIASCWSPDGKRIATIDKGKKVTIWL